MESSDQPGDTAEGGRVARCARALIPSELSTLVYILATAVDISITKAQIDEAVRRIIRDRVPAKRTR